MPSLPSLFRLTEKLGVKASPLAKAQSGVLTEPITVSSFYMGRAGRKPGGPKYGGRAPGTPNKYPSELRLDLLEALREMGFDPVAELVRVSREAWKEYERAGLIYDAIEEKREDAKIFTPLTDTAPLYLKIAKDCASDVMQFVYPKRKAVELTGKEGKDLFQSFTDLAKQIAMKEKQPDHDHAGTSLSTKEIPN